VEHKWIEGLHPDSLDKLKKAIQGAVLEVHENKRASLAPGCAFLIFKEVLLSMRNIARELRVIYNKKQLTDGIKNQLIDCVSEIFQKNIYRVILADLSGSLFCTHFDITITLLGESEELIQYHIDTYYYFYDDNDVYSEIKRFKLVDILYTFRRMLRRTARSISSAHDKVKELRELIMID
jgi:hypothetical protein